MTSRHSLVGLTVKKYRLDGTGKKIPAEVMEAAMKKIALVHQQ